MDSSFTIGRVMGIPIKLHITFLLILPIFAYYFAVNSQPYGFEGIEPITTRYLLSILAATLLFASILLHELAHSYMAKRYGVNIESITLFLFGGVSAMQEMPRKPGQEAKMAFAGPLTSLIIGSISLFIYANLISANAGIFQSLALYIPWILGILKILQSPALNILWILGIMNIILGLFNLIPAFPMDGGRVLRSFYATRMSYVKATQSAASVGKFFAILMALFGIYIKSLWFPLIALFIYMGASEEESSTKAEVTLENIFVKDIMTKDVVSVSPSMTVEQLVQFMFEKRHMGYPVIDRDSLKGVVTFADVHRVPNLDRPAALVSDIMTKEVITVPPNAQASDVLKLLSSRNIGRVMVVDNGALVGILSRTDLVRILRLRSE